MIWHETGDTQKSSFVVHKEIEKKGKGGFSQYTCCQRMSKLNQGNIVQIAIMAKLLNNRIISWLGSL